jgi:hypothetical protein
VNSRGKTIDGHAGDHVPLEGQDPRALASGRDADLTTTWQRRYDAEQDLRDLLERHRDELDRLPPGREVVFRDEPTHAPRRGYQSVAGGPPQEVAFDRVKVVLQRLPNGRLHVEQFTPRTY